MARRSHDFLGKVVTKFKVGDLVRDSWEGDIIGIAVGGRLKGRELGIVVKVWDKVEIPPLLEILWPDHGLSKCYGDDVELVAQLELDPDPDESRSNRA